MNNEQIEALNIIKEKAIAYITICESLLYFERNLGINDNIVKNFKNDIYKKYLEEYLEAKETCNKLNIDSEYCNLLIKK
jgi:hypothetical protein